MIDVTHSHQRTIHKQLACQPYAKNSVYTGSFQQKTADMRFLLALLMFISALHAREIFVSSSGNDVSGTGTLALPYRTLRHVLEPANALVQAGDIVTLRGSASGTFYDADEYRLRVRLTLRSFAGEWAILRCPITVLDGICLQIDPDASGSVVSRLEIQGGTIYSVFLQTDWEQDANPGGSGATDVLLEDCKLHGSGRDVVKVTPKSQRLHVRRCEIYNSGTSYAPGTPLDDKNAEGIDNVNADGMIVEDSYIHDIATSCLYFKGGAHNALIQRNRLENCGLGGVLVGFDTSPEFFDLQLNPGYFEALSSTVINNIIRNTDYAGIGLYASQGSKIYNNTLIDTARIGHAALYFGVTLQDFEPQALRPANQQVSLQNNIVRQSHDRCLSIRFANELGGLSGLLGSPGSNYNYYARSTGSCQFRDARPGAPLAQGTLAQWRAAQNVDAMSLEGALQLASDGHLIATSQAINRGVTLAEVTLDFDNQARIAPIDIGADEFSVSDQLFGNGFE
jgi:parallel beta-helix repeat protein